MKLLHTEVVQFQNCTAVNKRLSLWYTVHTYEKKTNVNKCVYVLSNSEY